MSGTDALIPGADQLIPRRNHAPEPETMAESQHEEKVLSSLADHPGWALFREKVLARCDQMEKLDGLDLANKSTAEVGEAFLIAKAAAARLRSEIKDVEVIARVVHNLKDTDGQ